MPTARIITRFPERAASLRKTLLKAGYHVEVVTPDCASGPADLEYDLDQMPEYASKATETGDGAQVGREFILAPHWRAFKSKFARPNKSVEAPAVWEAAAPQNTTQRTPSLEQQVVQAKSTGPTFKQQLAEKLAAVQQTLQQQRAEFEQKRAAKRIQISEQRRIREEQAAANRAQMAEQQRIREAETAAKREAERIAAERARAEAALRLQEQKDREAKHLAEIQAQMELRRQAEEQARREALERAQHESEESARREAEQRARLEAERIHILQADSTPTETQPAAAREKWSNHHIRRRFSELQEKAKATIQDWRTVEPSDSFPDTKRYAWRQAMPIATGIALAFALGWATAIGSSKMRANTPQPATETRVTPAPIVSSPAVPKTSTKSTHKPSPARAASSKHKTTHPVHRKNQQGKDLLDGDQDVIVRHHYTGKATVAKNNKGVKTITDIE